ncbi:MAG: GNAT family N-acetyltransferase [Anaerolineae bacterium]|nr:GNAT family N-acetyltransferase [Anaerolineae bacterium]
MTRRIGSHETYEIRQAVPEDCSGLAQVQVDSYRTAYTGLFPPSYLGQFTYEEQEQDWRGLLAAGGDDLLLVAASADGLVMGYTLARAQPDVYPGYDAEIVAMHVRRPFQRQGIGLALLCAALEALDHRACHTVMLWTLKGNPVRAWYERLGGQLLGEKSFQVDGWEIVEVAYGWNEAPLSTITCPHSSA